MRRFELWSHGVGYDERRWGGRGCARRANKGLEGGKMEGEGKSLQHFGTKEIFACIFLNLEGRGLGMPFNIMITSYFRRIKGRQRVVLMDSAGWKERWL